MVQIAIAPIAMVATPRAPCRPLLAQVSQRAETASGTAITADECSRFKPYQHCYRNTSSNKPRIAAHERRSACSL